MFERAPLPANEAARLEALRQLFILDTEPEPLFEAIARQASEICGTPIALVNLVDAERQWFKANLGLPGVTETPREMAFCSHVVADGAMLEVCDATRDPRFAANPLVTGEPHLRYYAGLPLAMESGENVGVLCVMDRQPRPQLTPAQAQALCGLAELLSKALDMRRSLMKTARSARSRYEAGLAEAESNYRTLIEDQLELVSLAKADGTLVYVNGAYAAHFGRSAAGFAGASLYEFVDPADRDTVRGVIDGLAASGEVRTTENRMRDARGHERWVAWTNRFRLDAEGRPMLHSVGRDITDRKSAEAELRASRALLERSGRLARVGGWELELASGTITWSAETRRIHEVDDDFVPTLDNAIGFYADEARPRIEAAVQRAMATGKPWDLELPLTTARGRAVWVRAFGEVESVDGRPVRLTGAIQDVTERRRLEERVADSERFLRGLTDALPLRIAYLDDQRRFRFVNQERARQFGLPREAIIGRTRAELRPDDDDSMFAQRVRAVLDGRTQHFEFDEVIAGRRRRFEHRLVPDAGADGKVRGFFVAGIDVTQRANAEMALRELTAIFDNTSDFVVQTDSEGRITYLNPSARRVLGMSPHESVAHRSFREFTTPETIQKLDEEIAPAVMHDGIWVGETTIVVAGGREMPTSHMVLAHRDAKGRVTRFSGILRDISAQAEANREIARQAETLRLVAEAIRAPVAVVGADRCYRFANSAFLRLAGLAGERIIGRPLAEVLGAQEYARRRLHVEAALGGQEVSFEVEQGRGEARSFHAVSYVPLTLGNGAPDGFVKVAQDITKQKLEELRLRSLAERDALTGLLNRAGFDAALDARQRHGGTLAVLYIDLDLFKPVNDTYGHPVGDDLLRQFGERLAKLVRPTDIVARLGGDEFAIAIPGLPGAAKAQLLADKVVAVARAPFAVGKLSLTIGASVGVAFDDLDAAAWRDVVARADERLLAAKAAGRGRQVAELR